MTAAEKNERALIWIRQRRIELQIEQASLNWAEDADGHPVYDPGAYAAERAEIRQRLDDLNELTALLVDGRTAF